MPFRRVLIIADIEGSSGCWSYAASSFLTDAWALACREMTRDVQAVVSALLRAGTREIIIKDFHRTGFNLLPELIDERARVDSGYARGPIPGMGHPGRAEAAMFLGLHAASGTEGFLAHTLTSRLAAVRVDGRLLPELPLFASLLAPYGIYPVFFSGCPVACRQAASIIPGIATHAIDKTEGPDDFDHDKWRQGLARHAVAALENRFTRLPENSAPLDVCVRFRDGAAVARTMARRWHLDRTGDTVFFEAANLAELFNRLSRICYLRPAWLPLLPVGLPLYNLFGRAGLAWVRHRLKRIAP